MNKEIIPILIIGAGPAGMTAAIYLSRANATFKIIDKYAQAANEYYADVENYPGIETIS